MALLYIRKQINETDYCLVAELTITDSVINYFGLCSFTNGDFFEPFENSQSDPQVSDLIKWLSERAKHTSKDSRKFIQKPHNDVINKILPWLKTLNSKLFVSIDEDYHRKW